MYNLSLTSFSAPLPPPLFFFLSPFLAPLLHAFCSSHFFSLLSSFFSVLPLNLQFHIISILFLLHHFTSISPDFSPESVKSQEKKTEGLWFLPSLHPEKGQGHVFFSLLQTQQQHNIIRAHFQYSHPAIDANLETENPNLHNPIDPPTTHLKQFNFPSRIIHRITSGTHIFWEKKTHHTEHGNTQETNSAA